MLTHPLLKDIYGQKEVDKFAQFLKKEIRINVEHLIDLAHMPSIAIKINGGTELASRDALGDGYISEKVEPSSLLGVTPIQPIQAGPFSALAYDKVTGKLTVDNNLFAKVYDSMIIYDETNNKKYPISLVQDDNTLFIDPGSELNANNLTVRLATTQVAHTRKYFFTQEDITLTMMATSQAETIYLYSIVMYMLGRYRIQLFDNANFRATTIRYTPIERVMDDPQNIYSREIVMTGEVTHDFIVSTAPLVQGIGTRVDISDMPATPQSILPQVKAQGWESPEDQ